MRFATFIAAALVAGCASETMPTNEALLVVPSIFAAPSPGTVALLAKRDAGGPFTRRECRYQVFIDGKQFAELKYGQAARIYPAAGQHVVGLRMPDFVCNAGGDKEISIELKPGQEAAVRISIDQLGAATIQQTAF